MGEDKRGQNNYTPRKRRRAPVRIDEDMVAKGRYPFLTVAYAYLDKKAKWFDAATLEVKKRNARTVQVVLTKLREEGEVSTTDPRSITPDDIVSLICYLRDEGKEPSYIQKLLEIAKPVLATVGNNAFTQLELEGYELPKRVRKELNSLSMTDLQQIQTAAQGMEGWWGDIARFMTFMYPYTGVRPSELRRALVQDINVRTWMFYVRHPKGEKKYGEKRTVPILPPARPAVLAFLEARKVGLNGRECDILVPTLRGSALDTYSENVWRRIKRNVAERAALPEQDWSLRSFRETYCQLNIDRDKNLMSAVSKAMGHGSTNTTEKYYGRIRQEAANNALVASWESASPGPTRAI